MIERNEWGKRAERVWGESWVNMETQLLVLEFFDSYRDILVAIIRILEKI